MAAIADVVFVAHASPNSKIERFFKDVSQWGKTIYTLEADANKTLITLGAKSITIPNMFK